MFRRLIQHPAEDLWQPDIKYPVQLLPDRQVWWNGLKNCCFCLVQEISRCSSLDVVFISFYAASGQWPELPTTGFPFVKLYILNVIGQYRIYLLFSLNHYFVCSHCMIIFLMPLISINKEISESVSFTIDYLLCFQCCQSKCADVQDQRE